MQTAYHITSTGELEFTQCFNGHPLDWQGSVLVILGIVVLVVDVSSKAKVCHLYHHVLVDPEVKVKEKNTEHDFGGKSDK